MPYVFVALVEEQCLLRMEAGHSNASLPGKFTRPLHFTTSLFRTGYYDLFAYYRHRNDALTQQKYSE
jgi:hypothetical protein